jgi:protein TonB
MSQFALPGPVALRDSDADEFPRSDRHLTLSAGTSLLLHGAALALLLITWHATPNVDPELHAIPVTLIKAEETAPTAVEAAKPERKPEPVIEHAAPPAPPVEAATPRVAKPLPPRPQIAAPRVTTPAPMPARPRPLTAVPHTNDDIASLLQEGVGGHPLTAPQLADRGASRSGIAIRSSAKVSDDYLIVLQGWLARYQNYPEAAKVKHEQGKGVVGFTVSRDGHVTKVWTDESTGTSELDSASIGMVRAASPVPPLPKDFAGDTIDFYFPVNYTLSNYDRLFQ